MLKMEVITPPRDELPTWALWTLTALLVPICGLLAGVGGCLLGTLLDLAVTP